MYIDITVKFFYTCLFRSNNFILNNLIKLKNTFYIINLIVKSITNILIHQKEGGVTGGGEVEEGGKSPGGS